MLRNTKIGSYEIPVGKYDKKIKLEEPISFYLKDYYEVTLNYESKDHRVKEETQVFVTREKLVFHMGHRKIHNCWVNLLIYRDLETNEFIISEYSEDNYAEIFYNYCDALGIVPLWQITSAFAFISKKNNGDYSVNYSTGRGKHIELEIEVPEYEKEVESESYYAKGELTNRARVDISIGVHGELMYIKKNEKIDLKNMMLTDIYLYIDYSYYRLHKVIVFYSDTGYGEINFEGIEFEKVVWFDINVKFIDKTEYPELSLNEIVIPIVTSIYKALEEIKVNEIIMELANEIFIYDNNE